MVTIYKNGEFEAWNYPISKFNFYENHNSKGLNFHHQVFFARLKWYFLRNWRNGCFNSMGLLHFHSEFTKQLACHSISVELMKHFSKHLKMFGTTVESQSRPDFW